MDAGHVVATTILSVGAVVSTAMSGICALYRKLKDQRSYSYTSSQFNKRRPPQPRKSIYKSDPKNLKTQKIPCSICLDIITKNINVLKCGHMFHMHCIEMHMKTGNDCPSCLQKFEDCIICEKKLLTGLKMFHCGHLYHADCIDEWFTCIDECPLCFNPNQANCR